MVQGEPHVPNPRTAHRAPLRHGHKPQVQHIRDTTSYLTRPTLTDTDLASWRVAGSLAEMQQTP